MPLDQLHSKTACINQLDMNRTECVLNMKENRIPNIAGMLYDDGVRIIKRAVSVI